MIPVACIARRARRGLILFLALGWWSITGAAQAGYVTQTLIFDQSNTFADGINYGAVFMEAYDGIGAPGGGLSAGQVRFSFTLTIPAEYGGIGDNFGFQKIGFNTDLTISAAQITAPPGWSVLYDQTMNGFGFFSVVLQGTGNSRVQSPVVLIDGLGTNATLDHFLILSTKKNGEPPDEGGAVFAGHVAGFNNSPGSHYIGDPLPETDEPISEAPEPATWILALCGISALGVTRFHRGKQ
ncbi:MAG: hypothetical protein ACK4RK_06335 [Gemmataceae bacterium]